jgi:hypothetical protein
MLSNADESAHYARVLYPRQFSRCGTRLSWRLDSMITGTRDHEMLTMPGLTCRCLGSAGAQHIDIATCRAINLICGRITIIVGLLIELDHGRVRYHRGGEVTFFNDHGPAICLVAKCSTGCAIQTSSESVTLAPASRCSIGETIQY